MKSISGRRMAQLAENKGWIIARVSGSHHIYTMDGRQERLVIPIHGNRDLKRGLQKALMKIVPLIDTEL